MKLVPIFLYTAMVMLALCLNIVNAATQRTFDPKVKGNLIGITLLSCLVLFLLVLLIFTIIRANIVTIKAYFRKRNPSIRAIGPKSRLNLENLTELEEATARSGMRPVELRDFADRRRHPVTSNIPIGTAMSDDTPKPDPGPVVVARPSLIGLGIMTGRTDEILGRPVALNPSALTGIGSQKPLEAEALGWGPPPFPPPTRPLPPIPAQKPSIPARNPRRRWASAVHRRRSWRVDAGTEVQEEEALTDEEAEKLMTEGVELVMDNKAKEDKGKEKEVYVEKEEKEEEEGEEKGNKEEKGNEVETYQGEEAGPSYTNGRFAARRSASADL